MREEGFAGRADLKAMATGDLIAETERHVANDEHWDYVVALHFRPEEAVFQAARAWCLSSDAALRSLGANTLGQLGVWDRPFRAQSLPVLWALLEDCSTEVLHSVIIALGHLDIAGEEGRLLPLLEHDSADVRYAIAVAIGSVPSDAAVRMLIELSEDAEIEVRSWATFGLGSQIDIDSEAIRDALFRRVTDPDHETRGEAFVGLARRKAKCVVAPLLDQLNSTCVGTMDVEAAGEIADPKLLDALKSLTDWWDVDDRLLRGAIAACESNAQGTDTQ